MLPRDLPHYNEMKGETILQFHGIGPYDITYVTAGDDPDQHQIEVPVIAKRSSLWPRDGRSARTWQWRMSAESNTRGIQSRRNHVEVRQHACGSDL